MRIVVDSNKIFSSILSPNNALSQVLFSDEIECIAPHYILIELFKYKEKIILITKKSEIEVLELFYLILLQLSFYNENDISNTSKQIAYDLCKDVDPKDSVFVALSIELDAPLWTGDQKLKKGLIQKGFTNFFDTIL
jgi:predicted nucleic acid-binding protein